MQEISDKMGNHQYANVSSICMDCEEEFILKLERVNETSIKISNGVIGKRGDIYMCKCQDCFDKNDHFGSKTEVYSRVVGYLRPIENWNLAKKDEFHLRKPYIVDEKNVL